jgi:ribonucleoside-triphosphate reductase
MIKPFIRHDEITKVLKKDGTTESWDWQKIFKCIRKAASRVNQEFDKYHEEDFKALYFGHTHNPVPTHEIHNAVIATLRDIGCSDIADAYQDFRDYKEKYSKLFSSIQETAENILFLGDRENANFDSSLISTKGSLIRGALTKELYVENYLSKKEKEYIKRGDIYIHDLRDMLMGSFNCCLFDMGNVLKGGFEMSNVKYTEPNSVLSALQVIGDVTLVATAQQFGGFTVAEIDSVLLPYAKKTYSKALNEAVDEFKLPYPKSVQYATKVLTKELKQGFQSLELKLNTVPCSRGDFAFTTLTFGVPPEDIRDMWIYELINTCLLEVRKEGHGGKPVVFPKLVFLHDKKLVESNPHVATVYNKCIECSSHCMYPDYLSLDTGKVAEIYNESNHKCITSPMGCRAFLSPWKDSDGNLRAVGRCNIGAVSLNLPVIMEYCKKTYKVFWKEHFFNELEERLETIREFLKKRYEVIKNAKASTNPMCFMQGGLIGGNLKANECVGNLTDYMTASFGFTAMNEATVLFTGKTLYEDNGQFAGQVLDFINDFVNEAKAVDGHLYAVYGTPAESLCGTQAKQYAEYSGDHQFGTYFSNSFHAHVNEDINPFQKQDVEYKNFHKANGGHITYGRLSNPENLVALKAIVDRGMELGLYYEVNFEAGYCDDCHKHFTNNKFSCPHCGSDNVSVISRLCGYLGYSKINGHTRINDAKMDEIRERKSM